MQFTPEQAQTLQLLLQWRRDVRHFTTDPVPEVMIDRLHAAMELSPSVGNARPWRVVRVCSPMLRAEVREEFLRCNNAAAAGYGGEQHAAYLKLKLAGLDKAPEHLAIFTVSDPEEGHRLGRQTVPFALEQSTAMAIHTLWLAARAENLGLGMVSILEPAAVERILGVVPDWKFSAYLCLGWPEVNDDTPLLHRIGWQKNHVHPWERR